MFLTFVIFEGVCCFSQGFNGGFVSPRSPQMFSEFCEFQWNFEELKGLSGCVPRDTLVRQIKNHAKPKRLQYLSKSFECNQKTHVSKKRHVFSQKRLMPPFTETDVPRIFFLCVHPKSVCITIIFMCPKKIRQSSVFTIQNCVPSSQHVAERLHTFLNETYWTLIPHSTGKGVSQKENSSFLSIFCVLVVTTVILPLLCDCEAVSD